MQLIRDLAINQDTAVVVVSHDPRLHDMADTVLWMEDGRVGPSHRDAGRHLA